MDIEKVAKAVRENTGEELPELEEALRQLEELMNKREGEKRRGDFICNIERDVDWRTLKMAYNPPLCLGAQLYDAGYRKVTPLTDEQRQEIYRMSCNVSIGGVVDAVERAILGETK